MGRKNDMGNSTSLVDQYRKQLGRQEKKVVTERRRELKRLKSEKETVSYWKVRSESQKNTPARLFRLAHHMDVGCCAEPGLCYLYLVYVLRGSEGRNLTDE